MNIFEANGVLDRYLEGYQERPGQAKMARALQSMLHNPDPQAPNVAIAEGPVGVGKSLAYLFASLISNGDLAGGRVIVSTSSIALQDQLVNKDLPFVRDVIAREFGHKLTFTALKGVSNYICLKRFYDNELGLDPDLSTYVQSTRSGEKPDLVDPAQWNLITTDSSGCEGRSCPVFDSCFYQNRKKQAASSDVVVVNHALLAADLKIKSFGGRGVLPEARFLVIDECHELENSVVNFTTRRLSGTAVRRLYSGLGDAIAKLKETVVLEGEQLAEVEEWIPALHDSLKGFDEFIDGVVREHPEGLIRASFDTMRWYDNLIALGSRLEKGDPIQEPDPFDDEGTPVSPVPRFVDQLMDFASRVLLLKERPANIAVYVEGAKSEHPAICITDIDAAGFLRPLWARRDMRFVLTSATCSVAGEFNYLRTQLGIQREQSVSGIFESPFDYKRQAMLIIPRHFDPRADDFDDQVTFGIERIINFGAEHGITKAMVLFTSYHQMNLIIPEVRSMFSQDYVVLDQNPAISRGFILEKFQNEPKSILVAQAASYGTGVDIKGDKIIIVVKLQFDVPTEPLFVARKEAIENNGGNSFNDLAIPSVIIRTKQQIGRSIRGDQERAIIAIFDGRLNKTRWGGRVLSSLPEMRLWTVDDWRPTGVAAR